MARAATGPSISELLDQLNHVSLDSSQIYTLREQEITRDRIHIYFHRGFLCLYKKVAGQITGAVFEGDGEILMMPPNAAEKFSLNEFTGSPILEEQFRSVAMRFTDQTAQELLTKARRPDPQDPEQPDGLIDRWDPIVAKLAPADSIRILEDLIGRRDLPLFDARVEGIHLGAFDAEDDERLEEPVIVAGSSKEANPRVDIWCAFASRASQKRPYGAEQPARVSQYKITTRINPDDSLDGQATLDVESQSSQDRMLKFEMSDGLRVAEVRNAAGEALSYFQRPAGPEMFREGQPDDWLSVILPAAIPKGTTYELQFKYSGNVIANLGNGVLFVGSHGSWYPDLPEDKSRFDLTFEYPDDLTLVATGDRVQKSSSGGWTASRWVSNGPFSVAGFNLGAYTSRARQVDGTMIEVYATSAVDAYLQKRYEELQEHKEVPKTEKKDGSSPAVAAPPAPPQLDPAALLDLVSIRAASAYQYFEKLFGPSGYSHLAITQIPGDLGQGWPELVYLPTISFLPAAQRTELGLRGESADIFASGAIAHEIAHQWWGNAVGWKTYHDIWMSEGMATFASALFMARDQGGDQTLSDILQAYKHDLLQTTKEGKTIESGGPIWLGWRLSNSLDPGGYSQIVYKKACWVLQMLRMIMSDPETGSDGRFFQMLHDFVTTYRGEAPDTSDFEHFASRYMNSRADLDEDHSLDWFFQEWVYSTGIPEYSVKQNIRQLAPGRFQAEGTIAQSGVAQDFEMLVPLIAVDAAGHSTRLAPVRVDSSGGTFKYVLHEKPEKIEIDENNILAIVR
jgi:hypothetical protein